jgi:recombination protein RecA
MATRKKTAVAPEAPKPRPRAKLRQPTETPTASSYFTSVESKSGLEFVGSGSAVMDAALGGGWVLGRVANIVGDRSSGKTLLAIEACANFHQRYPDGYIRYAEAEAAFDEKYAEALGMPVAAIDFAQGANAIVTVEDFSNDLTRIMDANKGKPILYILDSLDALSDEAEQGREISDASYGGSKPKKLGELFRRLVQRLADQRVLLVVISQLRDKLNVTFGEKQVRSGGRALDFYASHIVWLAEIGKIKRTMEGVERVTGVNVRARVKKNKVGLPFRECSYPILFGYGVDDLTANVEWLLEVKRDKRLEEVGMSRAGYKVRINNLRDKSNGIQEIRQKLNKMVVQEWQAIETGFMPKSRKY